MIHVVAPPFSDSWGAILLRAWESVDDVRFVAKKDLRAMAGDVVYFLDFHDDIDCASELTRSGVIVGGHVHGSSFDRMDPFFYRFLGTDIDYRERISRLVRLEREALSNYAFLTLNSPTQRDPLREAGVTCQLFVTGFPVIVPRIDVQDLPPSTVVLIQQRIMHDKQIGLAIELSYRLRAGGMEPVWLGPWNEHHANLVAFAEIVHEIPVVQYDYPMHWPTIARAKASITTSAHDTLGIRVIETLMLRRPFYVPDIPPFHWVPDQLRYRPYDLDHMVDLLTEEPQETVIADAHAQAMRYEAPRVLRHVIRILKNVAPSQDT